MDPAGWGSIPSLAIRLIRGRLASCWPHHNSTMHGRLRQHEPTVRRVRSVRLVVQPQREKKQEHHHVNRRSHVLDFSSHSCQGCLGRCCGEVNKLG
ncbi:hypothetical protein JZ751_005454 [Albula glossodonta]|uniref:Uncharacterized protein n=1 Tax=Albula glossodonta TaxID=121402 RepID=A0A8T2N5K2_9TELE|nr:hypothetical protein JZ751_005454 [Albula glossodonta]